MTFSQFPLPTKILLGISTLLILGIPFANLYIPYFDTMNFIDAYQAGPTADPHYFHRISIIILGFALTFFAGIVFVLSFFLKPTLQGSTLNSSLFLLSFALGFKNYPYWANGLLFQTRGIRNGSYDPKSILPQVILSDDWSMTILIVIMIFYAICWAIIPVILAFEFDSIKNGKLKQNNILALSAIALTFASFFATPEYFTWILD